MAPARGGPVPPWPLSGRETLADYRVFRVRRDRAVSPVTGDAHDFFVLEGADWVNVVALTGDGGMLFVRQYRHGTGSETLEIPGGCVDPGDASPLVAARRELREETGYVSDDWSPLGDVHPNPAILSNRCFTFLARGAVRAGEPAPDGNEDLRVDVIPRAEVDGLVRSGRITHALVLAALHLFALSASGSRSGE